MDPDDREFMRELLRRQGRATRSMLARFDAGARRRAESRAQRAALFRILDRLDEGGSAAGA